MGLIAARIPLSQYGHDAVVNGFSGPNGRLLPLLLQWSVVVCLRFFPSGERRERKERP